MTKVPNNSKTQEKCVCPRCPTFMANNCPAEKGENVYCATGKTNCELIKKGCLCGMCPLFEEYQLSKGYFCFTGAAE